MDELITAARDVQDRAHVPYSEYRVGAALETAAGEIFVGCNLENANFSNSPPRGRGRDRGSGQERPSGVRPAGREFGPPRRRHALRNVPADAYRVLRRRPRRLLRRGRGEEPTEYTLGELLPNTISQETLE